LGRHGGEGANANAHGHGEEHFELKNVYEAFDGGVEQ
jgi:hypothetical protein